MNILALCGSIRKESSNYALLKAVRNLLPQSAAWTDFDIKELPYFDPHLQFGAGIPEIVKSLRALAEKSDRIVISTPEYAHGIPGILKNALEWLVCEETMNKKVVVLIASPSGGGYVKEYLLETLTTMDMVAKQEMTLTVRSARNDVTPMGEIRNPTLQAEIQNFIVRNF